MATKFLVIILFLQFLTSCGKKSCLSDLGSGYSFKSGLDVTPAQDSIHIYDTIRLKLRMQTDLLDLRSNTIINFSGSENLGSVILFQKFNYINNTFEPSLSKFSFAVIKGEKFRADNYGGIEFGFIEEAGYYIFDLAIIPTDTGIYRFGPGNAANVSTKNEPCKKSNFTFIINNPDKHYYLYPGYTNPNPPTESATYFFKAIQ